jgi:hypothetical protein
MVPESPPNEAWAYDETTQWIPVRPTNPKPLDDYFLVLPPQADYKVGKHWQD